MLKERLGSRRMRFTDAERRRLARKAQALGRKVLTELDTLVTSDTLLRWYRELVASKWNYNLAPAHSPVPLHGSTLTLRGAKPVSACTQRAPRLMPSLT